MDEYPPVVDRRSVEKDTGATEHRIRFLFNMASMTDAEKAAAHSKAHQKWILDTLKESGGECTYEKLVEVGEEHQCDTVGAMLKILKNRKLIHFKQMFLMYPMHKDEIVKLKKVDGGAEDIVHKTSNLSVAPTKKSEQNEAPAPEIKARKESEASKKTLGKGTSVDNVPKPGGGSEQVVGAKLETAKAVVSPGSDNNATGQTYP